MTLNLINKIINTRRKTRTTFLKNHTIPSSNKKHLLQVRSNVEEINYIQIPPSSLLDWFDEMIRVLVFNGHRFLLVDRSLRSIERPALNTEQLIRIKAAALNFLKPGILQDFRGCDSRRRIRIKDTIKKSSLVWHESFKGYVMRTRSFDFTLGGTGGFGDWQWRRRYIGGGFDRGGVSEGVGSFGSLGDAFGGIGASFGASWRAGDCIIVWRRTCRGGRFKGHGGGDARESVVF